MPLRVARHQLAALSREDHAAVVLEEPPGPNAGTCGFLCNIFGSRRTTSGEMSFESPERGEGDTDRENVNLAFSLLSVYG